MKKILSILLGICLYLSFLSLPLGMSKAYAQTSPTAAIDKTEHWRAKQTSDYNSSIISAVLIFVIAWVGATLMKAEKKPPSVLVFIIGAIIYIGSEIYIGVSMKNQTTADITVYGQKNPLTTGQEDALQRLSTEYERLINLTKQRITAQWVVFGAFTAAAALALGEYLMIKSESAATQAALLAIGEKELAQCAATGNPASCQSGPIAIKAAGDVGRITDQITGDRSGVSSGGRIAEAPGTVGGGGAAGIGAGGGAGIAGSVGGGSGVTSGAIKSLSEVDPGLLSKVLEAAKGVRGSTNLFIHGTGKNQVIFTENSNTQPELPEGQTGNGLSYYSSSDGGFNCYS